MLNGDPMVRLYIPSHIKQAVVEQYHDKNGHMGIDKTFEAIRNKYYWPNMFKEIYAYVTTCVVCQTRNLKKVRAPMQETPVPPYPFFSHRCGREWTIPYYYVREQIYYWLY